MEPAALLKPSGKNVASVNHFCDEKKILLEPAYSVALSGDLLSGDRMRF